MNETTLATLLATALADDASTAGLTIVPFGTSGELAKPGAVCSFEGFGEDEVLLGSYVGQIMVRLYTLPGDTSAAEHIAFADALLALITSRTFLAGLSPDYTIPAASDGSDLWAPKRDTPAAAGAERETVVSVMASIVQLA
tara:strand:+ start:374 stop:796 length:423 start_codon:yes stop_codon:yes gene_type:complete